MSILVSANLFVHDVRASFTGCIVYSGADLIRVPPLYGQYFRAVGTAEHSSGTRRRLPAPPTATIWRMHSLRQSLPVGGCRGSADALPCDNRLVGGSRSTGRPMRGKL